jgi:hypothetical protein
MRFSTGRLAGVLSVAALGAAPAPAFPAPGVHWVGTWTASPRGGGPGQGSPRVTIAPGAEVASAGIAGNRVLADGAGDSALNRLDRDVLVTVAGYQALANSIDLSLFRSGVRVGR